MLSFKMFAGTNVGLRENNEDNFTVCPDLTKNEWIVPADNQQVLQLGKRGCVMVVADGMGGQNAGEVASAIAIGTVQKLLSPDSLPADVLDKSDTIKLFLKKVISECDIRIKKKTEEDPSTLGMGSTIVISWLINNKLYVAWLGDSRAYSYLPQKGIARLSKDHSYVQQLVDAGAITEDEAMDHPNSNVITRSLGDTSQKAKADVVEYAVEDGQIILLCSDGLCGVCKDEEIGGIIAEESADLQKCKERLTTAALSAGGSDNITISLLQISCDSSKNTSETSGTNEKKISLKTLYSAVLGLFLLSLVLYAGYTLVSHPKEVTKDKISISVDKDSLSLNEKTKYHLFVNDDALLYDFQYDKTLLTINTKDSIVSRVKTKQPILSDSTTCIKIVCRQDSTISSSIFITLKKMKMGQIFSEEEPTRNGLTSSSNDNNGDGTSEGENKSEETNEGLTISDESRPDQVTQN